MAEVDTSIYSKYPPAQPANLFDTVGKAAATQKALAEGQLIQQELAAREDVANAFQQARRRDGTLDTNAFDTMLQSNPATALKAQEIIGKNLEMEAKRLELQQKYASRMFDFVAPLVMKKNPTKDDVYQVLTTVTTDPATMNNINPGEIEAILNKVPLEDPAAVRSFALDYMRAMAAKSGRMKDITPNPQVFTDGANEFIVDSNIYTNPDFQDMVIKQKLRPAERAQQVPVVSRVGGREVQGVTPLGSLVDPYGNAQGAGGGAGGAAPPPDLNAPETPMPPGSVPQVSSRELQQGAPPGFVQSQLTPGESEARNVEAQNSAQQAAELQRAASIVPDQKAFLGNIESYLKDIKTGPGTEFRTFAKAFANRNIPFANFDPEDIATQEKFAKATFQVAQEQFKALGGTGTDTKYGSAISTSPSQMLSNLGNLGIVHLLKGNADAIAKLHEGWQNLVDQGVSPRDYGKYVREFNKDYDPRVFQFQYLDPKDRRKMLEGMNKDEKAKFYDKFDLAVEREWVPDKAGKKGK